MEFTATKKKRFFFLILVLDTLSLYFNVIFFISWGKGGEREGLWGYDVTIEFVGVIWFFCFA